MYGTFVFKVDVLGASLKQGEKSVPQKRCVCVGGAALLCSLLSDSEFSRTFPDDLLQARDPGSLTAECKDVGGRFGLRKLSFLQATEFAFILSLNQPTRHSAKHPVTALPIPTHSGLITITGGR